MQMQRHLNEKEWQTLADLASRAGFWEVANKARLEAEKLRLDRMTNEERYQELVKRAVNGTASNS